MTQERSSEYRGETREIAEAAYHADARAMAGMGYAPTTEDWSTVVEEVLTVRYVHAPELTSAVLHAVEEVEAERPSQGPVRTLSPGEQAVRRVVRRGVRAFDRLATELRVALGAITGFALGIAIWSFTGVLMFGQNPFMLFVGLFTLGFVGGLAGGMVALRRGSTT